LLGDDYADFFEDTEDMDADTNGIEHNGKSGDGSDIELSEDSIVNEMKKLQKIVSRQVVIYCPNLLPFPVEFITRSCTIRQGMGDCYYL
jgi:hypothetical protein